MQEISALDLNGTVVASTESKEVGANYEKSEFFIKGKDKFYFGGINYYGNETAYIMSAPVFNKSDARLIGLVLTRIYPRFIYEVTGDYTGLGESGEALLVENRNDEIVFLNPLRNNPDAALNLRFPLDSKIALPAILAAEGKNGTVMGTDYRGKEVFAAYTYLPAGNWGLVVKIDSSEALMPLTNFVERSILLGIIYLFLVVVLAYHFGKRFTAPLVRLSNASRKVARGYLTIHIEPESGDEIGELAKSFNAMVQIMKEVYEGLEQKVKDRTKDLNRRNLELSALIKTNQSISSGLDLNKILEIAVREAVKIVNVSYCSIILAEEGMESGLVCAEYSPTDHIKPSRGEKLFFRDFPILNEAFGQKRYVLVQNIRELALSEEERKMAERLDIGSILAMPLVLGEETLGIMQLISIGEVKEFTEEEINICQTIANQAAIAIENAHLFSELKRHDQTLETLFEIDRVVSQSLDLGELLNEALAKTIQVTSSDSGWIYLLDNDRKSLTMQARIGISPELFRAASKLTLEEGVSGMTVRSGKPVTMDIENYPFTRFRSIMVRNGIGSLAGVPLIAKGKILGALVLSSHIHKIFSKDDIDVLSSIGSQIGVAVENARLYSELMHHDRTMEALFEIDRVISQSLDLDEIFKESLAKTLEVTSSDGGAIYLLDGDKLRMKTSEGISRDFADAVAEIKTGEGIAGNAAKLKKPFVTDIDHYPTRSLLPFLEKEGFLALVGVPLMAKGRVVGAMNLANRRRRTFSKEDTDLLASIGGQIGVAIENAGLYQQVKASYDKLQATYEELKSLDKMKSEFLSNVSHELKTPLVSIRGYSELMYDNKLGDINPMQKKALDALIRNTERLTRLIDSLLFLSIQQMGKPDIRLKSGPQDMEEIITASLADIKVQAERKGIILEKDVFPSLQVIGDKDRLTELILNLLDNALKFTPPGGRIAVRGWN
ncbi:MAG TPA: GAF domain-containing protein, partial [Candidatus Methanoperedens sp.]